MRLDELAERIGAELRGAGDQEVERVASLPAAGPGDLSFLSSRSYRGQLPGTRASAVILGPEMAAECPCAALVMDDPYLGYALAAQALAGPPAAMRGVDPAATVAADAEVHPDAWVGPRAVVESGARLAAGAQVGPGCVVGRRARVGAGTRLSANVTVAAEVVLGARVLVQPGAVIGGDGFGFARDGERWVKIPQLGSVRVGDDVEIGANTTIDRGALDDTVIEDGVKLDNLVMIAHNVRVGAHTAIAGCVGIAGSTVIGQRCTLGGQVGVVGHLEIADDVHVTGATIVFQSITEPGVYSSGMPAQDNRGWRRNAPRLRQLDEMMKRLKALERRLGGS